MAKRPAFCKGDHPVEATSSAANSDVPARPNGTEATHQQILPFWKFINSGENGLDKCKTDVASLELNVNTFRGDIKLAALGDLDSLDGAVCRSSLGVLDLLDNLVAFKDLTEDDVLAIEPRGDNGGDEELGAVGVTTSVGHGEKTLLGVLELEVLVLEAVAVDGLATSAVTLGEVTALDHKVLDDAVEGRALVAEALLASGQSAEVLSSLGDSLAIETHDDAAERLITLLNVEVDLVGDLGTLGSLGRLGEEEEAEPKEQGRREKATKVEHDCCFSAN
jgi:hypothetical protein